MPRTEAAQIAAGTSYRPAGHRPLEHVDRRLMTPTARRHDAPLIGGQPGRRHFLKSGGPAQLLQFATRGEAEALFLADFFFKDGPRRRSCGEGAFEARSFAQSANGAHSLNRPRGLDDPVAGLGRVHRAHH